MSELKIPASWAIGTLADTIISSNQGINTTTEKVKYVELGKKVIQANNIGNNGFELEKLKYVSDETFSRCPVKFKPRVGDVLFCNIGSIGSAAVFQFSEEYLITWNVFRMTPYHHVLSKYLMFFLISNKKHFHKIATKSTMEFISSKVLLNIDFPIPPLKEQERIVKKIEACFSRIDETEKALDEAEKLLKKYRASLLAKAFRGELVAQDPNDESAAELLKRIRAEREKNQDGKKKKSNDLSQIEVNEKTLQIPESWGEIELGEVGTFVQGLQIPLEQQTTIPQKGFVRFIRIVDYTTQNNDIRYIEHPGEKYECDEKDLIMVRYGSPGMIGIGIQGVFANNLFKISIDRNIYFYKFMYWLFRERRFLDYITKNQKSSTMPAISHGQLKGYIIPFLPFKEQERIVKKIEACFSRIDVLENDIKHKKLSLIRLRESILNMAFSGELVSQIPEEGTGHDLLSQILNSEKPESVEKSPKRGRKK